MESLVEDLLKTKDELGVAIAKLLLNKGWMLNREEYQILKDFVWGRYFPTEDVFKIEGFDEDEMKALINKKFNFTPWLEEQILEVQQEEIAV